VSLSDGMNEFWIWFWRPIGEVLGALFLVVVVTAVFFVGVVLKFYWNKWINRKEAGE
jgi:hypothetical protein